MTRLNLLFSFLLLPASPPLPPPCLTPTTAFHSPRSQSQTLPETMPPQQLDHLLPPHHRSLPPLLLRHHRWAAPRPAPPPARRRQQQLLQGQGVRGRSLAFCFSRKTRRCRRVECVWCPQTGPCLLLKRSRGSPCRVFLAACFRSRPEHPKHDGSGHVAAPAPRYGLHRLHPHPYLRHPSLITPAVTAVTVGRSPTCTRADDARSAAAPAAPHRPRRRAGRWRRRLEVPDGTRQPQATGGSSRVKSVYILAKSSYRVSLYSSPGGSPGVPAFLEEPTQSGAGWGHRQRGGVRGLGAAARGLSA